MLRRSRFLLALPHVVLGALALQPSAAQAVDCGYDYTSGEAIFAGAGPSIWETTADEAEFEDGLIVQGALARQDAFDDYGRATINGTGYTNPDTNGCNRGDSNRTLAYPTDEGLITDVDVTPQLYVSGKHPFGRVYVAIKNTDTSPVTLDFKFDGDLGADSDAVEDRSSAGGNGMTAGDRWVTTCEDGDDDGCSNTKNERVRDPEIAHNWEGKDGSESVDDVGAPEAQGGDLDVTFENVSIPAGKTIAFMQVATLATKIKGARKAADAIDKNPQGYGVFDGLSDKEKSRIKNW